MKQLSSSPEQTPDLSNGKPLPETLGRRRRKFPAQQLSWVAICLVTGLLIVWAFRPTPIRVETAQVERGILQVTVDAEGKTRVRDRYRIAAQVSGQLDRITLDEGDQVEAGMVVARIDPLPQTAAVREVLGRLAELRAQRDGVETQRPKTEAMDQARNRIATAIALQQQAQARVAQVQAALAQVQRDRLRAQQLEAAGAISRQAREQAQLNESTKVKELAAATGEVQAAMSEVRAARDALALLQAQKSDPDYLLQVYNARIASTEAELSRLRDRARRTEMRSPIRGKVLRVLQKSSQFVNEGTPILELGNPTKLELLVDVLSTDAQKIQPGDKMLIKSETDAQFLKAQVRRVEPSAFTKVSALGVEEQRVNVIGDFIDHPQTMGDGYRVDVQIVVWESHNALKVPLSALFRCHNQAWCTFVVQDGKALRRQVEIGQRSSFAAEILQGLAVGESVILHPTEKIERGSRVNQF